MENKEGIMSTIIKLGLLVVRVLVVVFVITGSITLFKAVFKTIAFDEYPLAQYEMTASNLETGKDTLQSEKQLAVTRKLRMLEDYASAVTLLLLSGGLAWLLKSQEKRV